MNRNLKVTGPELAALLRAAKPQSGTKELARTYKGIRYDSPEEAAYAAHLDRQGLSWERQVVFTLDTINGKEVGIYTADFVVQINGTREVHEIKGYKRAKLSDNPIGRKRQLARGLDSGHFKAADRLRFKFFTLQYGDEFPWRVMALDRKSGQWVQIKMQFNSRRAA